MSLIVEDGSGVPGANTYTDIPEFIAFTTQRKMAIPDDPLELEALLIRAMDFLETLKYKGVRNDVVTPQSLSWPRAGVYADGRDIPFNEIPKQLIQAQCQLAFLAQTIDLQPTQAVDGKGPIQTESVYGAVARTYFQKAGPKLVPYISSVNALLDDYVIGMPGAGAFSTVAMRR